MMPEPRGWPRFLPRFGAEVSITFGDPINHILDPYIDALKKEEIQEDDSVRISKIQDSSTVSNSSSLINHPIEPRLPRRPRVFHQAPTEKGWPELESDSKGSISFSLDNLSKQRSRSRIAALLRIELANLGLRIRKELGEKDGLGELVHSEVQEEEEIVEEELERLKEEKKL